MRKALCAGVVMLLLLPAVLVAAPGEGIAGVDVGIRKRPGGQPAGSARTDASGAFAVGPRSVPPLAPARRKATSRVSASSSMLTSRDRRRHSAALCA